MINTQELLAKSTTVMLVDWMARQQMRGILSRGLGFSAEA